MQIPVFILVAMKRRSFLKHAGTGSLAMALPVLPLVQSKSSANSAWSIPAGDPDEIVKDESFWNTFREHFILPHGYINLENGYFSPQAWSTLQYHQERENDINTRTSWFMRNEQTASWENIRQRLADFLQVSANELALTRNTTESLNTIISGYPWKKGDEVIIGNQDYGSMKAAFRQAEKRFGIRIKTAAVPLIPENDLEVTHAYLKCISRKTRVIHLTHLINITGQVLPVAAICREAHKRGIEVMVDAAHSNAQLNFNIPSLEADYVAASLHKWLCCPLGTGYLWMKGTHISKIWPLMADEDFPTTDIRKFEHQGTRPVHSWETIAKAIDFYYYLGPELREKRLKYLMKTWCTEVSSMPGVQFLTPWNDDGRNSAIATIAVKGYQPAQLAELLWKRFQIFTVAIDHEVVKGVRITPHLFTAMDDIRALIRSFAEITAGLK